MGGSSRTVKDVFSAPQGGLCPALASGRRHALESRIVASAALGLFPRPASPCSRCNVLSRYVVRQRAPYDQLSRRIGASAPLLPRRVGRATRTLNQRTNENYDRCTTSLCYYVSSSSCLPALQILTSSNSSASPESIAVEDRVAVYRRLELKLAPDGFRFVDEFCGGDPAPYEVEVVDLDEDRTPRSLSSRAVASAPQSHWRQQCGSSSSLPRATNRTRIPCGMWTHSLRNTRDALTWFGDSNWTL